MFLNPQKSLEMCLLVRLVSVTLVDYAIIAFPNSKSFNACLLIILRFRRASGQIPNFMESRFGTDEI